MFYQNIIKSIELRPKNTMFFSGRRIFYLLKLV